jgi:starch synthase
MACETAVVATAVGGIPEVVVDGETGTLVPLDLVDGSIEPRDPDRFERDLAAAISALVGDPGRSRAMGLAGRRRAEEHFAWSSIARRTVDLYASLIEGRDAAVGSGRAEPTEGA